MSKCKIFTLKGQKYILFPRLISLVLIHSSTKVPKFQSNLKKILYDGTVCCLDVSAVL